jgi:hypothetical protein
MASACFMPSCEILTNSLKGHGVHAHARKHGFDSDFFVGISLVDMYAKYSNIEDGCQIFYNNNNNKLFLRS